LPSAGVILRHVSASSWLMAKGGAFLGVVEMVMEMELVLLRRSGWWLARRSVFRAGTLLHRGVCNLM
jgi:hypothetical protein